MQLPFYLNKAHNRTSRFTRRRDLRNHRNLRKQRQNRILRFLHSKTWRSKMQSHQVRSQRSLPLNNRKSLANRSKIRNLKPNRRSHQRRHLKKHLKRMQTPKKKSRCRQNRRRRRKRSQTKSKKKSKISLHRVWLGCSRKSE